MTPSEVPFYALASLSAGMGAASIRRRTWLIMASISIASAMGISPDSWVSGLRTAATIACAR